MQNNYDVIILGAGASGMTAAIAVHENGLSVGLFEKQDISWRYCRYFRRYYLGSNE